AEERFARLRWLYARRGEEEQSGGEWLWRGSHRPCAPGRGRSSIVFTMFPAEVFAYSTWTKSPGLSCAIPAPAFAAFTVMVSFQASLTTRRARPTPVTISRVRPGGSTDR